MKVFHCLFLCLFFSLPALFAQTQTFSIRKDVISDAYRKRVDSLVKQRPVFYEDEKYLISRTCSGEWGGTIKFKNKRSGIEYACSATCPVVVNKRDEKYIVTSTLAHMSGSSTILEISDPKKLAVYKPRKPRRKGGVQYVGDDESNADQGTVPLLDSIGVLTLGSFPYKNELFHVVIDRKKTYIAKIENRHFVVVDILHDKRMFTYDPEVIITEDNHHIMIIGSDCIEIFENDVTLYLATP